MTLLPSASSIAVNAFGSNDDKSESTVSLRGINMVDADRYPSRAIICGIITRGITLQSPLRSNSTRRHRAIVDCGENGNIYQGVVS